MIRDSRLSGVLHVLLHMAEHDGPVTSAALAVAMRTNPVVVRRTMAGLRAQGYVASTKGHGGGWTLARDLAAITLGDVYEALGRPALFAIGNRREAPDCLVEQAVNAALPGSSSQYGLCTELGRNEAANQQTMVMFRTPNPTLTIRSLGGVAPCPTTCRGTIVKAAAAVPAVLKKPRRVNAVWDMTCSLPVPAQLVDAVTQRQWRLF